MARRNHQTADRCAHPIIGAIRRRLGGVEFATTVEVAAATSVSTDIVRRWVSEGAVEAVDIAAAGRPIWRIYVPSVVAMYERKLEG
jgi:hypothetical protein